MIKKKPAHNKFFCLDCLKSGKGNPCGIQGHKIVLVSHKIHFPPVTASKLRWKEFISVVGLFRWGPFREIERSSKLLKTLEKKKKIVFTQAQKRELHVFEE